MCSECDQIDIKIARYERIKRQITDQKVINAAALLVAELEARKKALHPEK